MRFGQLGTVNRAPSLAPSLAGQIAQMFAASEPGVWYDPSDRSTLFQDAAGTTPVYMPGQGQVDPPVGLLLDKRRPRGGELFSDGAVIFSAPSARVSPGVYRVYSAAGEYTLVNFRPTGAVIGGWYELTFTVDSIGVAGAGMVLEGTSALSSTVVFNTVGKKTIIVQTTANYIGIKRASNAIDYQISGVSIRELPGNHAYQTTTTSRPTLSGRYNLLTNTNWSGAVVGAPGTAPTGWSASFNTAAITGVSQLGNDYAIQLTASAQRLFFAQAFSAAANTTYSLSCLVVENAGVPIEQMLGFTGVPAGATLQWYMNGVASTNGVFPVAGSRIELRLINGSTTGTPAARVGIGCAVNATGVVGLAQPDVRVTGDGVGLPTYQRVVDANTYDTAGFPLYLKFDGVDDGLRTSDIDFSGVTALFVAAAARKLSDAARGTLCELSSSYSNPGSFALEAPGITLNSFMFAHTGATTYKTLYRQLPAPVSAVVVGVSDLPSGYVRLSAKSPGYAQMSDVTTDVGGGSYAAASLFIGRRAGSSQPFNGRLYSLLIRGAATSDATIDTVERYLNSKARIY